VQSVSLAQVVAHPLAVVQVKPLQGMAVCLVHDPLPSQVAVAVYDPSLLQLGCPQTVVLPWNWQAPEPSQVPVSPHEPAVAATQVPEGSGFPDDTLVQVPSGFPVWVIKQAWQVPVHALLQQMLSTQ
jgi:hypothetical protein